MKRSEYISRIKDAILNRVRFHAPVCFDGEINKNVLKFNGVNLNYPIFKYDKKIDSSIIKAFKLALSEEKFNLLIPIEKLDAKSEKLLGKMENCVLYSEKSSPLNFVSMINKLNINYSVKSDYGVKFTDKFFSINDYIVNPIYSEFCLHKTEDIFGIYLSYDEFILNGNNIYVLLKNIQKEEKKISINLNIPLKKGYYYFKKKGNAIYVQNLLTGEKKIFSYVCKNAKFSFSCIDGIENSCFATINVRANLSLNPNEEKVLFFLLSNKKMPLKNKRDFEKLKAISIRKNMEVFDLRVKTKNVEFDQFFNNSLPKKIWLNWNMEKNNNSLVEKYITLRRLFIKGKDKIDFVPFKEIGLKELGIFNGEYYKKIIVAFGVEKFLQVGMTKFSNISNITNYSLRKNEPIYLSFSN